MYVLELYHILFYMSFKTYNFEQISKTILLFQKIDFMFCKAKCTLIMSFNKNY